MVMSMVGVVCDHQCVPYCCSGNSYLSLTSFTCIVHPRSKQVESWPSADIYEACKGLPAIPA